MPSRTGTEMSTLTRKRKQQPFAKRTKIEQLARKQLDGDCHFHHRVTGFQFEYREGVLTVRGRVPSFYLRQILERVLLRVKGVRSIDNQVDVISCDGLSSVRNSVGNR